MIEDIVIPVMILTGLGLLFSAILAVAYKKLRVYEDPRIDKVEELLPGANCGACGMPGCRAFSEAVVKGELPPSKCTVSSPSGIERIAGYLGVEAGRQEKRVARVLCAGGKEEAHNRASYIGGVRTCRGESVVAGGGKACTWGCLGLGDCAEVCDFDAIHMNADALPVVDIDRCTACGDCVDVCPKDLFVLMPIEQKLIVQCKSQLEGDLATDRCSVACNACGRCAADAPDGLIAIRQGYAQIDYSLNHLASPYATRRCPTGAIVWLDNGKQFESGHETELKTGHNLFDNNRYYQ